MKNRTREPQAPGPDLRTGSTTADDGAVLGWLSTGRGPGLVVVHGAMQSAGSQSDLARLLADRFTVHLMDRRGRGLSRAEPSVAHQPRSRTDTEVGDLSAVLAATGATAVLGISSGAIITLRAALTETTMTSIGIFEPPLAIAGSVRLELIEGYHREVAAGDLAGAMVSGMLVAEMGPAALRRLPRALLRAMTARMLRRDDARELPPGTPHLRQLAVALAADLDIVVENADRLSDFGDIRVPTLLVSGSRTPRYLQTAVSTLDGVIPGAERVVLTGTDHGVTQNRAEWGTPDRISPTLIDFFGSAEPS
jgi:pimeloyl-ACP methyl ester carboxylesterase